MLKDPPRPAKVDETFFTTMTDVTAAAYDTIKSFAQDANLPPYFTGNMSLYPGTSKLFYRAGDKTEYVATGTFKCYSTFPAPSTYPYLQDD